ncbi:hypothetical protein E4U61_005904 [Claviceps capensis]|nr:hypothetical protein E4U61_005904 [Claviceps capensis]
MQLFQQGVCNFPFLIAQFTAPSMLDSLNIMGFGSLSPIAGSHAANMQRGIENVVTRRKEFLFEAAERGNGG